MGIGPGDEPAAHGEGTRTCSSTPASRAVAPKMGARCSATARATASGRAHDVRSNEAGGAGSLTCRHSTGGSSSFFAPALKAGAAARLLMSPRIARGLTCCCGGGLVPLVTFPSARPGWVRVKIIKWHLIDACVCECVKACSEHMHHGIRAADR